MNYIYDPRFTTSTSITVPRRRTSIGVICKSLSTYGELQGITSCSNLASKWWPCTQDSRVWVWVLWTAVASDLASLLWFGGSDQRNQAWNPYKGWCLSYLYALIFYFVWVHPGIRGIPALLHLWFQISWRHREKFRWAKVFLYFAIFCLL